MGPREAARKPAAQGGQRREAASGASSRRRKLQLPAAIGAAARRPPLDKDQVRDATVRSEWESSLCDAIVGSPCDPLGGKLSDVTACERTADLPKVTEARSQIVESDISRAWRMMPRFNVTKRMIDQITPPSG